MSDYTYLTTAIKMYTLKTKRQTKNTARLGILSRKFKYCQVKRKKYIAMLQILNYQNYLHTAIKLRKNTDNMMP
jgi:hypothetical protein